MPLGTYRSHSQRHGLRLTYRSVQGTGDYSNDGRHEMRWLPVLYRNCLVKPIKLSLEFVIIVSIIINCLTMDIFIFIRQMSLLLQHVGNLRHRYGMVWYGMVWYTRVYRPTRHSIGHFGDGKPHT